MVVMRSIMQIKAKNVTIAAIEIILDSLEIFMIFVSQTCFQTFDDVLQIKSHQSIIKWAIIKKLKFNDFFLSGIPTRDVITIFTNDINKNVCIGSSTIQVTSFHENIIFYLSHFPICFQIFTNLDRLA